MIPETIRLYHPKGPDRVAVVSAQPATAQGGFLIQLARGTRPGPLKKGTVFGPFPKAELDARFAEVVNALKTEGFVTTGMHDLLSRLTATGSATRARAALGLGWRRSAEAVEPILTAMPKAIDEVCSYLDALGAIGDPRAIPVLREQSARKLLSRRRSAVEGLRSLNDLDGLTPARQQALERLPEPVRQLLNDKPNDAQPIADAVLALKPEHRGLALDTLYELGTPATLAVIRLALPELSFAQAHLWRYVKSIYKRAMLRHDYTTWGWLSHAIELASRGTTGTHATVKSGYDGVQKQTHIFGRKTQKFVRRLSWRYLRQLAAYRPASYANAAAEALIAYGPDDGENPHGLNGQFSACYLLTRILWGASTRLLLNDKSLRFRFRSSADVKVPVGVREEAHADLWDAYPRAYLRLLGAARLTQVHAFAVQAIETRHANVLREASHAEVVPLLQAPYEPTVKLGLAELERRFDPSNPDWELLDHLLCSDRPAARELGERWLRLTAPLWTTDVGRILMWLTSPHAATRSLATELVIVSLPAVQLRAALAVKILEMLRADQLKDDTVDGIVAVAQATLLEELAPLVSLQELLEWIGRNVLPIMPLVGALLGRRTESIADLGIDRLGWLAQHDTGAVRVGAHQLIRRHEAFFRDDPSLLLRLVESVWPDARKVAVDLLRVTLRPETLGLDGLLGFLDSNEVEVQNLGQELTRVRLGAVATDELVFRLVQHPHPNMRQFALDLVVRHLPDGADPLARLEAFLRAALFDLWPSRAIKQRVLAFLGERGLRDEQQAAVAVRILSDVVRVQGRADFEQALEALVRIKLAYPESASPVRLANMEAVT